MTLLAFVVPEPHYLRLLGFGVLLALALETARLRHCTVNRLFVKVLAPLLKHSEDAEVTGATHFAVAAFFSYYFFGEDIAIPVLLFHAVGDPISALVGERSPGPRYLGKSPVGSLSYLASGLVVWTTVSALGSGVWSPPFFVGLTVACLVEFLPSPVDDNLSVPLVAGAVVHLLVLAGL